MPETAQTSPASRGWHGHRESLFSFPDPVNEVSARLVAGGVVVMSALTIALDVPWLTLVIAYGFLARVASGPTLSPLGQLVTRVIVPRLPIAARPVPGPPKRFAQAIGATLSVAAAVLALVLGLTSAVYVLLGMLIAAATLESVLGLCLGCRMFSLLMRVGAIPPEVCERCADMTRELPGRA
jgi:Na+/H+-translocating membrane pyrophosphatase